MTRTVATLAAITLLLAGCAKGATQAKAPALPEKPADSKIGAITVGTAADSVGPAIEIPGGKKGGTIHALFSSDVAHLDPAQTYFVDQSQTSELLNRGLVGYKQLRSGDALIVGDLATDTGTTTDGGKTWTFTLKDGVKWEDGTPLTAADVKWSFERLFDPIITQGPVYIQQWLVKGDYRKAYPGPYGGKHLDAIKATDDKTVEFTLTEPHPDFNMALGMTGYEIVPKAQTEDRSKEKEYDKKPFSSGPYRVVSHIADKSMELERNPAWDPATDPIRNAYPDTWKFEFGVTIQQATDRFMADGGDDKYAINIYGIGPERQPEVLADAALSKRTISGLAPFTQYVAINTKRITNLKVRQAIQKAWPLAAIHKLSGGDMGYGYMASTAMNPTVVGYRKFDVYGQLDQPDGDVEAAKKLLAESGEKDPTVIYAYPNRPLAQKTALLVQEALTKAGFKYVGKEIDANLWGDTISKIDKKIDVHPTGWASDWPDASTVIPPLFDGRHLQDGSTNYSLYNNPEVNAAIDAANKLTDPIERGAAWSKIDEMAIKDVAIIPTFFRTYLDLHGSKVWGELDTLWGATNLKTVYVTE